MRMLLPVTEQFSVFVSRADSDLGLQVVDGPRRSTVPKLRQDRGSMALFVSFIQSNHAEQFTGFLLQVIPIQNPYRWDAEKGG
jgi:hypothetical protein